MNEYNNWREPLNPIIIEERNNIKNHNVYTHLACVVLRCFIGTMIILSQNYKYFQNNKKFEIGLLISCAFIIVFFMSRYLTRSHPTWWVPLRTGVAYSLIALMVHKNKYDIAGTIVIADALMGLQSRHMAHIASYLSKK